MQMFLFTYTLFYLKENNFISNAVIVEFFLKIVSSMYRGWSPRYNEANSYDTNRLDMAAVWT